MGTDIHDFTEVRRDGVWQPGPDGLYGDRNYDLFAILAGVRNGVGFAGVTTSTGFTTIAEPRGLPADATGESRTAAAEWEPDGHSHSWVTLEEILAFDWTRQTTKIGVVSLGTYLTWRATSAEGEPPRAYAASVGGPGIEVLAETDPRIQQALRDDRAGKSSQVSGISRPHVQVSWPTTYYGACKRFWSRSIPQLLRLGPPVDVRLVFFFDN